MKKAINMVIYVLVGMVFGFLGIVAVGQLFRLPLLWNDFLFKNVQYLAFVSWFGFTILSMTLINKKTKKFDNKMLLLLCAVSIFLLWVFFKLLVD